MPRAPARPRVHDAGGARPRTRDGDRERDVLAGRRRSHPGTAVSTASPADDAVGGAAWRYPQPRLAAQLRRLERAEPIVCDDRGRRRRRAHARAARRLHRADSGTGRDLAVLRRTRGRADRRAHLCRRRLGRPARRRPERAPVALDLRRGRVDRRAIDPPRRRTLHRHRRRSGTVPDHVPERHVDPLRPQTQPRAAPDALPPGGRTAARRCKPPHGAQRYARHSRENRAGGARDEQGLGHHRRTAARCDRERRPEDNVDGAWRRGGLRAADGLRECRQPPGRAWCGTLPRAGRARGARRFACPARPPALHRNGRRHARGRYDRAGLCLVRGPDDAHLPTTWHAASGRNAGVRLAADGICRGPDHGDRDRRRSCARVAVRSRLAHRRPEARREDHDRFGRRLARGPHDRRGRRGGAAGVRRDVAPPQFRGDEPRRSGARYRSTASKSARASRSSAIRRSRRRASAAPTIKSSARTTSMHWGFPCGRDVHSATGTSRGRRRCASSPKIS